MSSTTTLLRDFRFRIPLLSASLLLVATVASAQKLIVCDLESHVPLRDVIVYSDQNFRSKTDYRGICSVPATFRKLTFMKRGYNQETLTYEEVVADTVFLVPESHRLDVVTIYGKHMVNGDSLRKIIPYTDPLHERKVGFQGGAFVFDFANIIDLKAKRDRKDRKKTLEAFRKMDEAQDPIERAYEETMREKVRQQQEKKRRE